MTDERRPAGREGQPPSLSLPAGREGQPPSSERPANPADQPPTVGKKSIIRLYYFFQFSFTLLFWTPVFFEYQKRMGLSDPQIFHIQSIYYILFCVLELPTGFFADRFGYRRSLIWGSVVLVVANLVAGYFTSFGGFVLHWALIALARSFISGASTAYLYEYLRRTNAHEEFKQIEGNARAYSLFGRVLCFAVIGYLMAWKITLPYWLTAASGGVALLIAFRLPVSPVGIRSNEKVAPKYNLSVAFRHALRSPWLLTLMFQGIVIFVLARVISVNLFQPILGSKGFGIEAYGLVMAGMTLVEAFGSARPIWMRRWFSDVTSVFILSAIMAVTVALVPYFANVGTLVLFGIFSLVTGLSYPIQKQVMNEAIPDPAYRATLLSCESLIDRAVMAGVAALLEHLTHERDAFLLWVGVGSFFLVLAVQLVLHQLGKSRLTVGVTTS
ncbi:MAG: MFS transporter [Cryobacterium sp.]|nr:MFS transporter [Oligoflexia bacterium]